MANRNYFRGNRNGGGRHWCKTAADCLPHQTCRFGKCVSILDNKPGWDPWDEDGHGDPNDHGHPHPYTGHGCDYISSECRAEFCTPQSWNDCGLEGGPTTEEEVSTYCHCHCESVPGHNYTCNDHDIIAGSDPQCVPGWGDDTNWGMYCCDDSMNSCEAQCQRSCWSIWPGQPTGPEPGYNDPMNCSNNNCGGETCNSHQYCRGTSPGNCHCAPIPNGNDPYCYDNHECRQGYACVNNSCVPYDDVIEFPGGPGSAECYSCEQWNTHDWWMDDMMPCLDAIGSGPNLNGCSWDNLGGGCFCSSEFYDTATELQCCDPHYSWENCCFNAWLCPSYEGDWFCNDNCECEEELGR